MNAAERFWAARNERERRMLLAGGAVLLLLLVWLLLIEPALAGRSNWQERLPALRAERAQAAWDRPALERSLADAGLRPQSLNVGDVLVRANFNDVSFSALTGWLQQSQRNAQLAVSEANVSARERVDRVDATLALRRLP